MTDIAHLLTCLVKQFCWERTGTNTSAVCLHDAKHLTNLVRTKTQSGTCSGTDSVAGGYERIRAEIHIEHSALGALAENTLASLQHSVYLMLRVNEFELLDKLYAFEPFLLDLCDVIVGIVHGTQSFLVSCLVGSIFLFEVLKDVTYTKTGAGNLVRIGRTNALACCSNLVLTL